MGDRESRQNGHVHAMHGNPTGWRIFETANSKDGDDVFEPLRDFEASMRQQAMVADGDTLPKT